MKRDEHGIIIQPYGYRDNNTGIVYDDGGDSAFSTGLAAFGGSFKDTQLMPLFIKYIYKIKDVPIPIGTNLVRHPYQTFNTGTHPHNDPRTTSRDQVIAFFAGFIHKGYWSVADSIKIRAAAERYAKDHRVNNDVLGPTDIAFLWLVAANIKPSIFARLWLVGEIFWSKWVDPTHELNQLSVKCYAFGSKYMKLLYFARPDLEDNIREYFGGWRERAEIGEGMIKRFRERIGK